MITDISQLDLTKKYSYEDYLTWQFDEMVELIKGKIFKMSPAPLISHQRISGKLNYIFYDFFKNKKCEVFAAPFDVTLLNKKKSIKDKDIFTVIQPDLCVICDVEKLKNGKKCLGSPDLIIEILSPGNSKKEMGVKFDLYEENEVKEYWIVEPLNQTINIYILRDGKYIGLKPFTTDDKIKSIIFPELEFEVKDVFNKCSLK